MGCQGRGRPVGSFRGRASGTASGGREGAGPRLRGRREDRSTRGAVRGDGRRHLGAAASAGSRRGAASLVRPGGLHGARAALRRGRRRHRALLGRARAAGRAARSVRPDPGLAEARWALSDVAEPRRRPGPNGPLARSRHVLLRLRRRGQPWAPPRRRVRPPRRRARLDAGARERGRIPMGAGAEAGMRRLPATTVYYGLELLLSMPTWVVMSVYLVRELDL